MKRGIVLLVFSIFLLNIIALNLALSQEDIPGMPAGLNPEKIEETKGKIESKWDYLSRHWKIILLSNPVVKAIDSAFTKADEKIKIFRILFGIPWNLGLTTIIAILLWFIFLFYSAGQFNKAIGFEKLYCFILSLAFVIILAQLKVFILISSTLFSLFTTTSGKITLIVAFLIVLLIMAIINILSLRAQKSRQQNEINETKQEMTRIRRFSEKFFSWVRKPS